MTTIIKRCRGVKTRGIQLMDLEKKITVLDFQSPKCPEFEVKSKIGKIFKNHNPLLLKLMKLTLIFINIMKKKKKLIKVGVDIYYLELMFILINYY